MPNDVPSRAIRTTPATVAFATWRGLPALSDDDRLAATAVARHGLAVVPAVWDDPAVDWTAFAAVVVRSTWDYHHRPGEFLAWIARLALAGVRVWNPPPLLRWNLDKRYLAELAGAGIPVVPTVTVPRGSRTSLAGALASAGWDDVVVKPAVSASAHETWRSSRARAPADAARFSALVRTGDVLVQPYQPAIERGEWSLCFLGGEYSHAVLKRPRRGDFRVQSELGGAVVVEAPSPALIRQAEAVVAHIPGPWLYARMDACDERGTLVLMELELIEPTLFFHADSAAAGRFAEALRT